MMVVMGDVKLDVCTITLVSSTAFIRVCKPDLETTFRECNDKTAREREKLGITPSEVENDGVGERGRGRCGGGREEMNDDGNGSGSTGGQISVI